MSKPIIEVKNLSKVYNIGHEQKSAPGTLTFRDSLTQTLRKPIEIFTGHRIEQEKFWALKNVNFEVNQGDVVGIIGRNGSGKSTLLKVLSRIVEPTEGEITMRGRVASLLEVGTGFHPELTGRENVYFNGAILGMSQKEIKSKFDEIVAFSEVEKFLDTPVKFYSSGMYVRLAFAVAAHLDPDILIVDEVLAVGDVAFQKKCLGKMKDVAGQGRTVLFVSHSMDMVSQLCSRGVLMKDGKVDMVGQIEDVIEAYSELGSISASRVQIDPSMQEIGASARILGIRFVDSTTKREIMPIKTMQGWSLLADIDIKDSRVNSVAVNVGIQTAGGLPVWTIWGKPVDLSEGQYEATLCLDEVMLEASQYQVTVSIVAEGKIINSLKEPIVFSVASGDGPVQPFRTSSHGTILNQPKVKIIKKEK